MVKLQVMVPAISKMEVIILEIFKKASLTEEVFLLM